MNIRPILFQPWKVRKILDWDWSIPGDMQTRRIIKPQPLPWASRFEPAPYQDGNVSFGNAGDWVQMSRNAQSIRGLGHCRYGVPGDRLWVKETYQFYHRPDGDPYLGPIPKEPVEGAGICYKADVKDAEGWRPSIFMPRWASRITLEVVSVRVERLQDISPHDVVAEGIDGGFGDLARRVEYMLLFHESLRDQFAKVWDSINGKKIGFSWADNPWLWVVQFRMVKNG